jgi:hypothetical protein
MENNVEKENQKDPSTPDTSTPPDEVRYLGDLRVRRTWDRAGKGFVRSSNGLSKETIELLKNKPPSNELK